MKLTLETTFDYQYFTTFNGVLTQYQNPFSFDPLRLPGFSDYIATSSEFRILRASIRISTIDQASASSNTPGQQGANFLACPSKPFALVRPPVNASDPQTPSEYLHYITEAEMRQSRWQKVIYPNATTNSFRLGFRPYTFIATYGPSADTTQRVWQRPYSARRWMPITWVQGSTGLRFYGPYVAQSTQRADATTQSSWTGIRTTLEIWCQFRGQH